MPGSIWSRSRFWLCHFLHNRHVRLPMDTLHPSPQPTLADQAIHAWLQRFSARAERMPAWPVDAALATHADDPAFVQCLRLWIKEEQYLVQLARHLLPPSTPGITSGITSIPARVVGGFSNANSDFGSSFRAQAGAMGLIPPLPGLRRRLGLRCELSILLLGNVLELASLTHLQTRATDPALRRGLEQMLQDRQQHVAFAAEWLTREFADFNFLRRNLRRLRLRLLFALMLTDYLCHQAGTLGALGLSRGQVLMETWRSFARLLESMVPYHRDVLLARLLSQHQRPYDQPVRMW